MSGPNLDKVGAPGSLPVPAATLDDRIMDDLRIPDTAKRFECLKQAFEGLNPSDAKSLLDRLNAKNEKDPLSSQFYAAFKGAELGQLKGILEAKSGVSQAKPEQQLPAGQTAAPTGAAEKKGEIGLEANVRQTQLRGQLLTDEAKRIAGDANLKPEEKRTKLQSLMESAGKEEFKQLLSAAHKWPDSEQGAFSAALGLSENLMKRVGAELSTKDQMRALELTEMMETGPNEDEKAITEKMDKAMKAWVGSTNRVPFIN